MDKTMTKIHNKMKARIKNNNDRNKYKIGLYRSFKLVIEQYAKDYPNDMHKLFNTMTGIFNSENLEFHFNKNDKATLLELVSDVPMQQAEQYYKNNPSHIGTLQGGLKTVPDNDDYFLINLIVGYKIKPVKITMKELANKELDKYMY